MFCRLKHWNNGLLYIQCSMFSVQCSQSKQGCLKPRKKVWPQDVLIGILMVFIKIISFTFWSSWVLFSWVSDLLFSSIKYAGYKNVQFFISLFFFLFCLLWVVNKHTWVPVPVHLKYRPQFTFGIRVWGTFPTTTTTIHGSITSLRMAGALVKKPTTLKQF